MTDDEQRDRLHLERKVERAFYEAGKSLAEIRDRRLYRNTHQTFEKYCLDRFGFTRMAASYKIASAKVIDNLSTNGLQSKIDEMSTNGLQNLETEMRTNGLQNDPENLSTNGLQTEPTEMSPNGTQILPTSERQVRPLTKLKPEQQREVWRKAVEEAGGKVPTGRMVKSIVEQIKKRPKVPNPWRVGEVCSIIVKDNPDLRGKGGCWAIITAIGDFSCTVRLWDGEYQVKLENLRELPYSKEQQEAVKGLCGRLQRIFDERLSQIKVEDTEKPVRDFLSGLGKLDRPWLTELEEKVLKVIEEI